MPKPTFNKLDKEKRRIFVRTCLREFAHHGFESASITYIVKELAIAKGSVYQYFDNKEDLYKFLVRMSSDRKFQILTFVDERYQGTLAGWFTRICIAELKFSNEFPEMYRLLVRHDCDFPNNEFSGVESSFLRGSIRKFFRPDMDALSLKDLVLVVSGIKTRLINELRQASETEALQSISRISSYSFSKNA